jgi:hypothetical protein
MDAWNTSELVGNSFDFDNFSSNMGRGRIPEDDSFQDLGDDDTSNGDYD